MGDSASLSFEGKPGGVRRQSRGVVPSRVPGAVTCGTSSGVCKAGCVGLMGISAVKSVCYSLRGLSIHTQLLTLTTGSYSSSRGSSTLF